MHSIILATLRDKAIQLILTCELQTKVCVCVCVDPEILRFVCEHGVVYVCSCVHMCFCTCSFSWMPRKILGVLPTTFISEVQGLDFSILATPSCQWAPMISLSLSLQPPSSVQGYRHFILPIDFIWMLKIQAQASMLKQQALYQYNHFPSSLITLC